MDFIIECIIGFLDKLGDWLGWRFFFPVTVAILIGVGIRITAPEGTSTTPFLVILGVLGVASGALWRFKGGKD